VSYGHRLMCDVETQFIVWYKIVSGGTTALCEIGPFFLSGSARPAKKGDLISFQVSIATQSTVVGAHRRSTYSAFSRAVQGSASAVNFNVSAPCLFGIAHPWIRAFTLD
jgi:hypothetical protein